MAPLVDQAGYWGERTSTVDWCEKNYVESYYVAEMWNTVSNLVMMLQALYGIYDVFRNDFEKKFIIAYTFLFVVGMGSWAFHMTLLYEMQLFDELPMVWGTCFSLYLLCDIKSPKSLSKPGLVAGLLLSISFTLIYLYNPLPVLHNTAFAILAISSYVLQICMIRQTRCRLCATLYALSFACYLFGFALWNVDKFYCDNLTSFRESIPGWISPTTQLHAWWHCFAGHGTYLSVLLTIHLHYDFHPRRDQSRLKISYCGFNVHWTQDGGKSK
ncbi:alkaline ceramidase 3 [Diaphorina citri]|uniref:Alkaline ceramidase n=1 Tax=Diaphorina citri TaxID=121845 RepID=A0A1S3CTC7_DIACI|nr:alkaline ceramidase 3 [Diaphorina citri]KAI5756172.1 hypothetical protein M8J77_022733 [Diaphorina citri]